MSQILLLEQLPKQDKTQPHKAHKKPKAQQVKIKETLVACKKFRYIGDQVYTFKDEFGYTHKAEPNQILIVPVGSLSRHFKFKKLFFKEL